MIAAARTLLDEFSAAMAGETGPAEDRASGCVLGRLEADMHVRWGAALAVLVAFLAVSLGAYVANERGGDVLRPSSEPTAGLDREGALEAPAVAAPTLTGRPVPEAPLDEEEAGIFGRVVDVRDGSAVPGVCVLVRGDVPPAEGEEDWKRATLTTFTSEASGEFRVRLEPGGVVHLLAVGGGWVNAEVAAPGFTWRDRQRWRSERRKGRWIAHDVHVRPAACIEGRVSRADGSPASGALVRPLEQEADPATEPSWFPWAAVPEVRCDEDGRFLLDGLPLATTLLLGARHPDCGEAHAGPVDLAPGRATSVDIKFPPNRDVRVQVVDAGGGTPVEGASVVASWPQVGAKARHLARRGERPSVVRSATTDAQGMGRLAGLPEAALRLSVAATDYLPLVSQRNAWEDILKGWRGPGDAVRLVLHRGAWITGRLELPEHVRDPWLELKCEALDAPGFAEFEATASIERDGAFRVLAPPTGKFRLSAYLHTYSWTVDGSLEVDAGETDVVFRPEIRGQQRPPPDTRPRWDVRVVGPEGQRVDWVSVGDLGDGSAHLSARGTKDADCRVQIIVHRGGSGVWLSLSGGVTLDGERLGGTIVGPFDARSGEDEVRLPGAWSVSGHVLDADGKPVQGARVRAHAEPPGQWLEVKEADDWPEWSSTHGDGYTDRDGRFDISGLGDQAYLLTVDEMGALRPPAPIRVTEAAQVTLHMISGITHRVTILGAEGEAIAGATLHVGQTDGARGPSDGSLVRGFATDEQGVAVVGDLEPGGTYTLSLHGAYPYTDRGLGRTILTGWKPKDDVIRLDPRNEVRGTVVDEAGNPIVRAYVYMKDATGAVRREETERDGTFAFGGVVPGLVRLAALYNRGGFGWDPPSEFPVEARAGEEGVIVRLVSLRDLTITCDARSAPDKVPSWWYLVRLDGSEAPERYREYAPSRSRAVRFWDLEPGMRYRLWAGPTDDGWYLLADIGPEDTTATVPLRQGATVSGRLRLPPGTAGASVAVTDPGVVLRATARVEDGRWVLRGVPEGTWTLEASCYVDGDARSAFVRIKPGDAPDIDLTKDSDR